MSFIIPIFDREVLSFAQLEPQDVAGGKMEKTFQEQRNNLQRNWEHLQATDISTKKGTVFQKEELTLNRFCYLNGMKKEIKFIDLFAGIGGIRLGLERALKAAGYKTKCVFTSEIKEGAIKVLKQNHPKEKICGDITKINESDIPDFDFLCAGFPCQAFSAAGKRLGFVDTRGTLFFEVERILRAKRPKGFILENVEGLTNHDGGNTLNVILSHLEDIGYSVSYKVLNAKDFGVPQDRKRIYIVGTFTGKEVSLEFENQPAILEEVLEKGLPTSKSKFVKNLLSKYTVKQLYGKSIKDKRGGSDNIHSWDLEIKGATTKEERNLLNLILKERRKRKWADEIGIKWMDGMPLTYKQIKTFCNYPDLKKMLDKLTVQGYLSLEHPKQLRTIVGENGAVATIREEDPSLPKGYNIIAGKLSFEVSKILDPRKIAPTLVAMDMQRLFVPDGKGVRKLTLREGLRLCGYPEDYKFDISEKEGFDLLGNTVVVPVIQSVATRLIQTIGRL